MSRGCVLIVDDEPEIRHLVQEILEDENYQAVTAANAEAAREAVKKRRPDLVLLDIWMPDCDGITLLKEWFDDGISGLPVVMISGHGTIETAVEAIRLGACDFIEKPLSTARLLSCVEHALQIARPDPRNPRAGSDLPAVLVGKSAAMGQLRSDIARVAAHDSPVLIMGEVGSGRNLTARALHAQSARRNGPFIAARATEAASNGFAARLFGHETGEESTPCLLDQARGGTLLLEEIGDMDAMTQEILRDVLERRHFRRVDGRQQIPLNTRIIATSSRDLEPGAGWFDKDLYHHLGLILLYAPALREHRDDVPELIDHFLRRAVENEQLPYAKFSTAALNSLRNHTWPGNVGELRMLVRRLLVLKKGREVTQGDIRQALRRQKRVAPSALPESFFDMPLREARDRFERDYLLHHLERAEGNIGDLALAVKMERTHLYRKLKGLGIELWRIKEK
ncbi:MAG: sigma-54-dependent transcriptional regulator [Acidiferrobacterales bacterium]